MEKTTSIQLLNKALGEELQAVHQYMYFHFHLNDQGLSPLAGLFKRTAIKEMGHAESLAERILFLNGDVEMAPAGPVEKILDPKEMLAKGMAMEDGSAKFYNKAALECSAALDSGSKEVFEHLVRDEEGHFSQFEQQREHIERFGLSYLALQSFGGGTPAAESEPAE